MESINSFIMSVLQEMGDWRRGVPLPPWVFVSADSKRVTWQQLESVSNERVLKSLD
jgi:hypothetical protein